MLIVNVASECGYTRQYEGLEKFLVSRDGTVAGRFRSDTELDDPALLGAVEQDLAA